MPQEDIQEIIKDRDHLMGKRATEMAFTEEREMMDAFMTDPYVLNISWNT